MVKIKYQLTTISSLIVSPRSNLAWYIDPENSSSEQANLEKLPCDFLKKDNLKVIYPFYQYGEYEEWSNTANYYLPGSSIKGALCDKQTNRNNIMVDDIQIPNNYIVLRNLYKVQYLMDLNKAKYDIFIDNLGVQMVKANDKEHLNGELYLKEPNDMAKLMNQANNSAKIKMKQMIEYLSIICKTEYKQELKDILLNAITKLEALIQDEDVILIGGYKGLLHSMEVQNVSPLEKNENGAIYLDPDTNLMHGLVRIQVVE